MLFCRRKYNSFADKWNDCAVKTHDLSGAYSTYVYREGEIGLFRRYFSPLKGKRFLKLDLWNEARNTRILEWPAREGSNIYGVDISENITRAAKNNFERQNLKSKFVVADILHLPFKSNQFDYIYTMGTIEHNSYPEKSLSEISRILKPNGIAIVGVPNRFDPFLRPVFVWILTLLGMYPYAPESPYSRRKLKRVIREANLEIVDNTGVLFMPGILRMIELGLYKYYPEFSNKLFSPIFKFFHSIEKKYNWAKKNAYLIACVCKKNYCDKQ